MTTPRIEEIYYNKIDPEVMDFQIHVREVTGGNNYAMVDSTKLGQACRKALTEAHQTGIDEAVEKLKPFIKRVRLDVDVIICDCGEKYKDSDLDLSVGELEQALDDTIKALQNNK